MTEPIASVPDVGSVACRPRSTQLAASRLYVCTGARQDRGDLAEFLHAAYSGGADIIQLRDKSIDTADELAALRLLAAIAAEHGRLFAVNDRADIGAVVGADIVHIGQRDLSPAQVRQLLGEDVLVGISTHTDEQAAAARADDRIDYFCTGPVWETPTKPGRAATGLDFVARTADAMRAPETAPNARKPWFAIGGIDQARVPEVRAAGAERVVVVRAVTDALSPRAAAAQLRQLLPD